MKPHRVFLSAWLAGSALPLAADPIQVASPDGRNILTIDRAGDRVTYAISSSGSEVIDATPVSITINGIVLPGGPPAGAIQRREVRETTVPVVATHASSFPDAFNEALIQFGDAVSLRCRSYDDGVAFRWEISMDEAEVTVDGEALALGFAKDFPIYFPDHNGEGFFSHQECRFEKVPVSKTAGRKTASPPLLVEWGEDRWLLVSDVNVEGYPGMWFEGGSSTTLGAVFPPYPLETKLNGDRSLEVSKPAGFIAKTAGTRSFPWRAFVLSDGAGLLTSSLLYNLAEPSRLEDPSWIEPGKVAWDWWNANNIHGVPFRAGINQDTYRHYIDFAAEMGIPYIILDEGWSVRGPDNLLKVVPEIRMQELADYGRSKDVRLILWMTSVALENNFEDAFEQFEKWGVAGLKIDFMQRDDQVMMEFMYRISAEAARRRLLVNFHGGSKPAGLLRTWPNVLTHESVLGLEQSKWGEDASPPMAALLPFTRMVVGPMDYTPGAMVNLQRKSFQPMYETPASQGTRAHQLAMYVVYLSPLQMLSDTPTNYRRNPESLPFLKEVPVTWDETRVLEAEVGRCVAVARRKGDDWFIGALNDWEARDLDLPLGFLGAGNHEITIWQDGPNADRNGNDIAVHTRTAEATGRLKVHLAPGGGFAAIIRK